MKMVARHWHRFEEGEQKPPFGDVYPNKPDEINLTAEEVLKLAEDFQIMLRRADDGKMEIWFNKKGRTWGMR